MRKITIMLALLLSLQSINLGTGAKSQTTKVEQRQKVRPSNSKDFTASVEKKIIQLGIENPKIVFLQFREESGNGGSDLSRLHNNIMGMKYPRSRKTLAIGKTKSGYAIYSSWEDSLKDYQILQKMNYTGLTERQYLQKLRKSYAQKSDYLKNYL